MTKTKSSEKDSSDNTCIKFVHLSIIDFLCKYKVQHRNMRQS